MAQVSGGAGRRPGATVAHRTDESTVYIHLEQLLAFLGAAVLITLSPGPDNLMVLTMGASRGRREGMIFGFGCALGCLSHTAPAAVGLGPPWRRRRSRSRRSRWAAACSCPGWASRPCGAAGGSITPRDGAAAPREALRRLFAKGLVANGINPKVILFFLAFLPQFVEGARGGVGWQIAQHGLVFTVQAAVLFAAVGYSAGAIEAWRARTPRAAAWLDRIAGGVFTALGLRLLFTR